MHFIKSMLRTTNSSKMGMIKIWIACVLVGFCGVSAKVTPKITCEDETMTVELSGPNLLDAYLKGLKNYPEPACLPHRTENSLRFRLSLNSEEFARCGTSQILNKITGSLTFYNRIIVIDREGKDVEIMVKCKQEGELGGTPTEVGDNHLYNATVRRRRDVLPAGFEEQEDPIRNYNYEQMGLAPEPILSMLVKQEGRTIGQELLVQPGAPLTMEVSHIERPLHPDPRAIKDQDVYGIIVSRLDVTDTQDQSEVILVNGCSVDSYLFENFVNVDGDTLSAKFRAFKFPDSSYVLFQATVNVCLGSCRPSQCSNGQTGYGRRRRRSLMSNSNKDDNNGNNVNDLYQFRINTLLRIENSESGLDEGTILYGRRRLNLDNYRLTGNGDILALSRLTNGSGASSSISGGIVILTLLSITFVRRWIWNLS